MSVVRDSQNNQVANLNTLREYFYAVSHSNYNFFDHLVRISNDDGVLLIVDHLFVSCDCMYAFKKLFISL